MPSPETVFPGTSDTLLTISTFGTLLYQARGLTQTLAVIPASQQLERTVNGSLVDVSASQFRKYSTVIVAGDVDAPPLDGVWPGMTVTIDCVCQLAYQVGNPGSPGRTYATGTTTYSRGDFYCYRPQLVMLVKSLDVSLEEWKGDYKWKLEAEEV